MLEKDNFEAEKSQVPLEEEKVPYIEEIFDSSCEFEPENSNKYWFESAIENVIETTDRNDQQK